MFEKKEIHKADAPKVILTNGSDSITSALHIVWPKSKLLFSSSQVLHVSYLHALQDNIYNLLRVLIAILAYPISFASAFLCAILILFVILVLKCGFYHDVRQMKF